MNQKLVQKHQTIISISLLAMLGLAALAISQIRLAKIRKQEAIAKANLFHFMQQNKELQQKQDNTEKKMTDLSVAN
jgi:Tfp pilus assembly protein PilV